MQATICCYQCSQEGQPTSLTDYSLHKIDYKMPLSTYKKQMSIYHRVLQTITKSGRSLTMAKAKEKEFSLAQEKREQTHI